MARILSIATTAPDHVVPLPEAERIVRRLVEGWGSSAEAYVRILHNTRVEHRHAVFGEDLLFEPHTLKERNDLYIQTCIELGERAVLEALDRAQLQPGDIDAIISTSCTGYMIPSIDAYLIDRLKMRASTRRLPITELGCAAGAVGLTRAWEQLKVYPGSRVLLLSIELPSLTFQTQDQRPAQVISSMIFADGAAALVLGHEGNTPSPRILGSRTYTVPGSLGDMGYDLDDQGLHIILSAKVPFHIQSTLGAQVDALLMEHGVSRSEIRWCAMHPAGPKVLDMVQAELKFTREQLEPSWKVLREYGNMSSAAVLFVLAEMMRNPVARPGELGLIVAFGPGVSGEIVLARWEA